MAEEQEGTVEQPAEQSGSAEGPVIDTGADGSTSAVPAERVPETIDAVEPIDEVETTDAVEPIDEAETTDAPLGGLLTPPNKEHGGSRTRRYIAYGLLLILGVLVATGCAGWLFFERDEADFQSFAVMFSPVVTLVATVLAFYFGSPKD